MAGGADPAAAGLAFFLYNTNNFYRALVSNISGEFTVERRTPTQWTPLYPFLTSAAIRKGATADNEISVKMSGNHALLSVNDKPVAEFDAAVAYVNDAQSTFVDLAWVTYDSTAPAFSFTFKNLQVRETQ